jgi:ParB family chromosome partitioning protein
MPANIAMEIARAPDGDVPRALAEAYENKLLPGNQVLAIRRIILQRNQRRKKMPRGGHGVPHTGQVTAASLIQSYENEALRRLFADEEFLTLLRAEAMHTLPQPLAEQLELSEA